jgi:hypothetical protein
VETVFGQAELAEGMAGLGAFLEMLQGASEVELHPVGVGVGRAQFRGSLGVAERFCDP